MNKIKWVWLLCVFTISFSACSGTRLISSKTSKEYSGKPVSDILVIVVDKNHDNRQLFENMFVNAFKEKGLDAVSSIEAVAVGADFKMKREEIVSAVQKYNSDAVLVTGLVGVDEKDIYTKGIRTRMGFFDYYGYSWGFTYNTPGSSKDRITVVLKTNLFDVATQQSIWSGESESINKETQFHVMDDVISLVTKELLNKKVIAPVSQN